MKKFITATLLLISFGMAHGQLSSKPFAFGVVDEIQSAELGEKRTLNIYLPYGYTPDSAAKYRVLYLLDGSAHEDYAHIAGLVEFLGTYGIIPPTMVVGIANVDRRRDFTYPTTIQADRDWVPTGGGSAKFIRFIENELQPFVNARYKNNGHKTILGQSLGGLLGSEILVTKPQLFDEYILVSPSLWWDNRSLLPKAAEMLKANPNLHKKIYIGVGANEPAEILVPARKLTALLKKHAGPQVTWHFDCLKKEDHATVLHRSAYNAFEWLNRKK